uniref:CAP10 domain-containing protein n=2 Tax=Caenorhabditis tropicalis TaxID=1561998 RepID=A0A1I7TW24_9PELO
MRTYSTNFNIFIFKLLKFPGTFIIFIFLIYYYKTYKKVDFLGIRYPPAPLLFNTSQKYLSSNLASFCQLGNHIFEFAALYGLSKRLGRIPVFFIENGHHQKMLETTRRVIPGLIDKFLILNGSVPDSIPLTVFHGKCCTYEDPEILESISDEYLHLSGVLYQSWKYFPNMRDAFIDFLKPPDYDSFGNLPKSDENTHVTCVHTRRGDFVEYNFYSSDPVFIRNALIFMNQKKMTKNIRKTVIFGDDLNFMKSIFEDHVLSDEDNEHGTNFISRNSPSDDLIYSKFNCDSVLISAPRSTFGFWMGYFSSGDTVFHLDVRYASDYVTESGNFTSNDFFLPHWTPLMFSSSDNLTVVESFK